MTQSRHIALIAAGLATLVLLVVGGKYASSAMAARDAAKELREQETTCEQNVKDKDAYAVKDCLDKKRLPAERIAEAKAVLVQASKARSDAIAKLTSANPAVLAMMQKWLAAKSDDYMLAIGVKFINGGDAVPFPGGVSHSFGVQPDDALSDVWSMWKDKLAGISIETHGGGCTESPNRLNFEVTYVMHDSGDTATLEYGSNTVMVHIIAYDIETVACYQGERVTVASIKGRPMPLPANYTQEGDPGSAESVAQLEMDKGAARLMSSTIGNALGVW